MDSPIRRVTLQRFRSFVSATLDFDNPLFLVGRNGSGKSNFVDAFAFTAESMSSPLQAVFDRRGGIQAVRNRSSVRSAPPKLGLAFEFGRFNGIEGGRYAFEVKALPNYAFAILREQCVVTRSDGSRSWFDRDEAWRTNADGLTPALEPTSLALPLVGGDERFASVVKLLGAMRTYAIEPVKLREMQDPDSGLALRADGGNAASVLQELLRGEGAAARRQEIEEILASIVPETTGVRPLKHGQKLTMAFTQEWAAGKRLEFEAFSMSDGTLRTLGLILAVFQRPSPALLVLEEPEATIHPGALGAVLDLVRRAAKSMQVVITTHSPDLLDAPWIGADNLRIVDWSQGASHVGSPSDATRAALRQHLMGAGELLRSNALTPVPLFEAADSIAAPSLFERLG